LIVRDDRVLLVRRAQAPWAGLWEVPGGFCDGDEHPADAARREMREELGLTVRLVGVLGVYFDPYTDDDTAHVMTFVAETAQTADEPAPNADEVLDARWFPLDALPPACECVPGCHDRLHDWALVRGGGASPGLGLQRS
jgi:ADP-ribose pyrophosphatase YjhB (NUDIX family)